VHEQHGRAARARPAQRLGARLVAARHDEVAAVRAPQPRLSVAMGVDQERRAAAAERAAVQRRLRLRAVIIAVGPER